MVLEIYELLQKDNCFSTLSPRKRSLNVSIKMLSFVDILDKTTSWSFDGSTLSIPISYLFLL